MTPFSVYEAYLSIKTHFKSDSYDYHKFNGKIRSATEKSYWKRRDKLFFAKLAKKYSRSELVNFMVANFVAKTNPWVGDFSDEAYVQWDKKIQSLEYVFKSDIRTIIDHMDLTNQGFNTVFTSTDGNHPDIVKLLLSGDISIETFSILDTILGFCRHLDKTLIDPIIWPDLSKKIRKYRPFLQVDQEKMKKILKKEIISL